MKKSKKSSSEGLTRRDLLKASGVALGGLAFGGAMVGTGAGKALAQQQCRPNGCNYPWTLLPRRSIAYPTDYTLRYVYAGHAARC